MITDTICLSVEELFPFYKAFERVSAINYVTIDSVSFEPERSKYAYLRVSAISASSFYALGFYQELLFPSTELRNAILNQKTA